MSIDNDVLNPATTFTLANVILTLTGYATAGTTNDVVGQTPININSLIYTGVNHGTDFLTVLHELAHLAEVIPAVGAPGLSAVNDQTVRDNCSKTIGREQ